MLLNIPVLNFLFWGEVNQQQKSQKLNVLVSTEALKGHLQRNNYLQCWLKILDKMRNIRSS